MDFGEKGNYYRSLEEDQAQSDIRERSTEKKAWLKHEREIRGLPENACIYCGKPMEKWRLELDLPDCEKCRRERRQNGLSVSVQEMAFSQR